LGIERCHAKTRSFQTDFSGQLDPQRITTGISAADRAQTIK